MPDAPHPSTSTTFQRLELATKVVAAIVAAAVFIWGIYTFSVTSYRQASKPFYDKQLELYFSAAETAATLASSTDPAERLRARGRFMQLYWGPLSIVEDAIPGTPVVKRDDEPRTVEEAMIGFRKLLLEVEQRAAAENRPINADDLTPLEIPSYWLAHRLRDSLKTSWPVSQ